MGFQKGKPRHPGAGRKKGTPNKFTQDLMVKCEAAGVDVFEAMLEIAADRDDPNRFSCLKELAQYLYPKRKALEISNGDGEGFRIVLCDYVSNKKDT